MSTLATDAGDPTDPAGPDPIDGGGPSDRTVTDFDVCGPLPTGTTVLEASAGTGKTYTIAALAARYLAEGVPLDAIMMVTFSRAATSELRVRVRDRLVAVEQALARRVDDAPGAPSEPSADDDPVTALLTSGDAETLALRRHRLAVALAEFDDATIATTHEFCARMLDGLGVLSHADPGRRFVDSLGDLTADVTVDTYLRLFADGPQDPPFGLDLAHGITDAVTRHPHLPLVPTGAGDHPVVAARLAYAEQVRAETARRSRALRLFTHDDIIRSLHDSLADPDHGGAAVGQVRERYRVVLVDEFQDTDPVQWEIVRRAFDGHATVILIGDPKQAIYAFRGADVNAYLDAVATAGGRSTISVNRRSDASVVAAVEHLFAGAALGDERIVVRPVTAHHAERRLRDAGGAPVTPMRIRMIPSDPSADKDPSVGSLRPRVRDDLVAQTVDLLGSGRQIVGADGTERALQPGDLAVLVRKNATAEAVCAALTDAGVPAVQAGASTVLTTDIATQWLTLLTAVTDTRAATIRRAALTPFVGWDFTRLASASEDDLADLSTRVRRWRRELTGRGVAAMLELIIDDTDLPSRLLSRPDGERVMTDLRHVAQLLHARMTRHHLGPPALADWLAESIAEARRAGEDERSRRLETDSEAVQVVTVHRAKGLEFGVVLLPEVWDHHLGDDAGRVLKLHAPDGTTVLDVGGTDGRGRAERYRRMLAEEAGEELRLLYVAMTRARHEIVAWWAPSYNTNGSPLHRLLYGPRRPGAVPPVTAPRPGDPDTLELNARLIAVETVPDTPLPVPGPAAAGEVPRLDARRFDRSIDTGWRRTSYTALTAAAHPAPTLDVTAPGGRTGAEPADDGLPADDERIAEDVEGSPGDAGAGGVVPGGVGSPDLRPSPMGDLPAGAEFGTIMHAIFEHLDTAADDLPAELAAMTAAELARTPYPVAADELATALLPGLLTPLGPLAGSRRLADVTTADRLSELDFELPLAGGSRPRRDPSGAPAGARLRDVAALLSDRLAPDDPLVEYPAALAAEPVGDELLRGFLTGSIDSVLRIPAEPGPRHLVVDYKSNWLGEFGRPLVLGDYHPARLAQAMMRAHYPLQALLYSVAVHRFLRWRQPGYDPDVHLGGICYLFVRGMAGPDTPAVDGVPYGVFSWDPGGRLVTELSDLLDRGAR